MLNRLRIATRKSPLALWQAEFVKSQLETLHPHLQVELVTFTTRGDKILDTPLAKIGGKGLFVKELEHALLEGDADIAVHSMKDVPMEFPEGLGLSVICERESPLDALVSNHYSTLDDLPQGAVLGTSSLRRQCQVQALRPDLVIKSLRGNVQTRLGKLDAGEFDAIILATAGLNRLELQTRIQQEIADTISLPAGGQGAMGIETRSDDDEIHRLLQPLNHDATVLCVRAERALNQHLQGGCQVPIACYGILNKEKTQLYLRGLVGSVDGQQILRAEAKADLSQADSVNLAPESLGIAVAKDLLAQGAEKILAEVYDADH